jgi:hypothetical protein
MEVINQSSCGNQVAHVVPAIYVSAVGRAQFTEGPFVVQIWSRNDPESGLNETLVLH